MARPKIYDEPRVTTAVRLPVSLHADLRRAASAQSVSVNHLVTRAVTVLLAHDTAEPTKRRRRTVAS